MGELTIPWEAIIRIQVGDFFRHWKVSLRWFQSSTVRLQWIWSNIIICLKKKSFYARLLVDYLLSLKSLLSGPPLWLHFWCRQSTFQFLIGDVTSTNQISGSLLKHWGSRLLKALKENYYAITKSCTFSNLNILSVNVEACTMFVDKWAYLS